MGQVAEGFFLRFAQMYPGLFRACGRTETLDGTAGGEYCWGMMAGDPAEGAFTVRITPTAVK